MKRFQVLLPLAILILAGCIDRPVNNQEPSVPGNAITTPTPTVIGTWEMIIEGVIYDQSTGEPISGASVSYVVVHSYFPEIQAGRLKETRSDVHGEFKLPMIVHDTDNIHIVVEANGYSSYDEKLDLLGSRYLDIKLAPLATDISP